MPAKPTIRTPSPVRRASRDIAEHVKAWRKLNGLTQSQLADRAGLDRKTVIKLEAGDSSIGLDVLLRLLNALGILDRVVEAADPYETDIGRLRADERLPERVRPRSLRS
jgi:transcriptional regulator with XRE-family HTH domain